MRLILWIVAPVILLVAIVFAVHNYARATIDLWPFPISLDMPIYAVVLISIVAGFLIGATAAWLGGGKWRKLARQRERAVASLNRQLAAVKESEPVTLEPRASTAARPPQAVHQPAMVPTDRLPPVQR